ncbi:jg14567 [Pararge aegeria aegeria]|uniref:Jg14567 protein n=1 Tax=Pararge aegeria aegeria TaxID=348720 RepID=A0A8S4S842_9NEOP|nr:jg14567 [Pararge aegeria aegeria]
MDPPEESTLSRNRGKHDCESEVPTNCKGSSKQPGQGDCEENVFTSMSHETDLRTCPLNGPRARSLNSLTNIELGQSSIRLPENNVRPESSNAPQTSKNANKSSIHQFDLVSASKSDTNRCDNGLGSNQEKQTCQKHKVCLESVGNYSLNAPSTSGASTSKASESLLDNTGFRESRKRPSSLKLNKLNLDADEDSSSDTGNDDYSLGSEDGCIYTYRGGEHLADLPSSFFSLDMGLPLDKHLPLPPNYQVAQPAGPNAREQGSRVSSPDMDFLEMDFDPGPSCEVDTGDESTPDADLDVGNMPEENEPIIARGTSPEYLPSAVQPQPIAIASSSQENVEPEACCSNEPSTSKTIEPAQEPDNARGIQTFGPYITHVNVRGEQLLVRRTMSNWPGNHIVSMHASSGDLVSPREILNYDEEHAEQPFAYQINQGERPAHSSVNLSSALYHVTMAKKLMVEKATSDIESHDAERMAQSNEPLETSSESNVACVEPPRCMVWSEREACERQVTQIGTSACGATAVVNTFIALGVPVDIERINTAVGTRLRANYAPLPRYLLTRAVAGCTAADIVTGIQRASDGLVTARFFPTHPERAISLSHWLADWISLGQVVNVIREFRAAGWSEHGTRPRHIRIPASYQAGVTVAALTGSEAHRRLMHAPQLPVLSPETRPA